MRHQILDKTLIFIINTLIRTRKSSLPLLFSLHLLLLGLSAERNLSSSLRHISAVPIYHFQRTKIVRSSVTKLRHYVTACSGLLHVFHETKIYTEQLIIEETN